MPDPVGAPRRNDMRFRYDDPEAARRLAAEFHRALLPLIRSGGQWREPALVCIGTDRSTGDALGPLVGSFLLDQGVPGRMVRGTLPEPVHATNLTGIMDSLCRTVPLPVVVAVDACLGRMENVGAITLAQGPLRPGAGVNKQLPEVGELHLTGTVNVGGFMEYFVLQNTRLSLVMEMARTIAEGIAGALRRL